MALELRNQLNELLGVSLSSTVVFDYPTARAIAKLIQRLLEKRPDLQIILLTGHASLEKGVEAIKIGAMDFLEKPAEIQALMEKIKEAKARKMLLVEKGIEDRLKGILGSKSW